MQRVPKVTEEDVLRVVARDFPPELNNQVLELLSQFPAAYGTAGAARVQLAILKMSNGDVGRLRENVAIAIVDFRDALLAAEYPGGLSSENWAQYEAWLHR